MSSEFSLTLFEGTEQRLTPIEQALAGAMDQMALCYEPQYEIPPYRCDFAFPHYRLIVECDGHEYHHTKEQRANDARRMRKLLRSGWAVMRFTGSEIYADADLCAMEVRDVIEKTERRRRVIQQSIDNGD